MKTTSEARRRLLKALATGGAGAAALKLLPDPWTKPLVDSVVLPAHAQATLIGCQFVGSWLVSDGPNWQTNPPCYTGQEAAALLFGGSPSDYRISTVSDEVADINDRAWLDGHSDEDTYGPPGSGAPHDFKADIAPAGYEEPSGEGNAYSAYVSDHDMDARNYAFRCEER